MHVLGSPKENINFVDTSFTSSQLNAISIYRQFTHLHILMYVGKIAMQMKNEGRDVIETDRSGCYADQKKIKGLRIDRKVSMDHTGPLNIGHVIPVNKLEFIDKIFINFGYKFQLPKSTAKVGMI